MVGHGDEERATVHILAVEDEARLATLLRRGLTEEGCDVDLVSAGEEALERVAAHDYDAMVLDAALPDGDGLAVCRGLRRGRNHTPILLLTECGAAADGGAGLEAGADDYLVKPFAVAELLDRLWALTHRPSQATSRVLRAGEVRLDPVARRAWRGAEEVRLPTKAFHLLEYLLRHPNRVLTRAMIAERVWAYNYPNATNVIEVYVRQLRQKLADPYPGRLIQTVRGAGYRLVPDA